MSVELNLSETIRLPDDLYYFVLSYIHDTGGEWFLLKGVGQCKPNALGFPQMIVKDEFTDEEIDGLIQAAIKYNLDQVVHKNDITLEDIERITK